MRGPILTVELINRCFLGDMYNITELFEPSAAGRIAISSDLLVGLHLFTYFSVENGGSSWNFWKLAIGEAGQLEVKDEKENMPLVDRVTTVA